jgi:hypothetical protein
MTPSSRYCQEVREGGVRLVLDRKRDNEAQWAAITSVAERSGYTAETLRRWVCEAVW